MVTKDAKQHEIAGDILRGEEMTFREASKQWLQTVGIHSKQSTLVKYQNFLFNHILPTLGDYPLSAIDAPCLENMLQQKLTNGRLDGKGGLSTKTVKDMLSVVREIIRYMDVRGYRNAHNLSNIPIRNSESQLQILNHDAQLKLEQYLNNNCCPRNIGILISLYMGLRLGEVCALRWQDIHLEENALYVKYTMQRIQTMKKNVQRGSKTTIIITPPKSSSSLRVVPIPSRMLEQLKGIKCDNPEAFLLTGKSSKYVEPRTMQNYFRKILGLCGISGYNYHILRHTFATRCIESGFDIKSLSEILGHSNVNITLNRYMHSSFEWKQKNMQLLEAWTMQE